jgi:hypothetical protein
MRPTKRLILYAAAVLSLVAVGALYTQPDFLVQMSNQLWACF